MLKDKLCFYIKLENYYFSLQIVYLLNSNLPFPFTQNIPSKITHKSIRQLRSLHKFLANGYLLGVFPKQVNRIIQILEVKGGIYSNSKNFRILFTI